MKRSRNNQREGSDLDAYFPLEGLSLQAFPHLWPAPVRVSVGPEGQFNLSLVSYSRRELHDIYAEAQKEETDGMVPVSAKADTRPEGLYPVFELS